MRVRKEFRFWGDVINGRLTLHDKQRFEKYLLGVKGLVSIDIKPKKKKRTTPQNSLYWLWVTIIADYCGYDPEEMHDTFKSLYNTERKMLTNQKTGEVREIKVIRSTTVLNIVEFCDYMEGVARYASELGITLPNPEDYEKTN